MKKSTRVRLAIATTFVAIVAGGSAANALVFADASAPLTLKDGTTELAQARGSVSDSSSDNFSYTAGYQRDRLSNGDSVFTKIDTDFSAKVYDLSGAYKGIFNFNNIERVRTGATSSAAWTRQADKTVSVTGSSFRALHGTTYTVDVRICEDRGILRADPCKTKTLSLTN